MLCDHEVIERARHMRELHEVATLRAELESRDFFKNSRTRKEERSKPVVVRIFVKTCGGKKNALEAESCMTIASLKTKVQVRKADATAIGAANEPLSVRRRACVRKQCLLQQELGIAAAQQSLVFDGAQLDDQRRLCDYRIENDSTVLVVVAVPGMAYLAIRLHGDSVVVEVSLAKTFAPWPLAWVGGGGDGDGDGGTLGSHRSRTACRHRPF